MLEDGLPIIVKEDIQLINHSEPCCMNLISSSIELPADGIIPTNFVRVDRHNIHNMWIDIISVMQLMDINL